MITFAVDDDDDDDNDSYTLLVAEVSNKRTDCDVELGVDDDDDKVEDDDNCERSSSSVVRPSYNSSPD